MTKTYGKNGNIKVNVFDSYEELSLAAADFVTVSNEEHAIAKVIYDIESGKYRL